MRIPRDQLDAHKGSTVRFAGTTGQGQRHCRIMRVYAHCVRVKFTDTGETDTVHPDDLATL